MRQVPRIRRPGLPRAGRVRQGHTGSIQGRRADRARQGPRLDGGAGTSARPADPQQGHADRPLPHRCRAENGTPCRLPRRPRRDLRLHRALLGYRLSPAGPQRSGPHREKEPAVLPVAAPGGSRKPRPVQFQTAITRGAPVLGARTGHIQLPRHPIGSRRD